MSLLEEVEKIAKNAELLFSAAEVEACIARLANEITRRIGDDNPIVLAVLNGGIIFAGQLLTRLDFPLEIDSVQASRYRGATTGGEVHWLLKPSLNLRGRKVLVLDDILDEGMTLSAIIDWCKDQGADEVLTGVLIDKQIGRMRPCKADFVGLVAENRYLFGYGMDYKNYLRNAPGIFACNFD